MSRDSCVEVSEVVACRRTLSGMGTVLGMRRRVLDLSKRVRGASERPESPPELLAGGCA